MNQEVSKLMDEDPDQIFNFVDTMGFNDTRILLKDEQISNLIKSELLEKTSCNEIDGILVFESA